MCLFSRCLVQRKGDRPLLYLTKLGVSLDSKWHKPGIRAELSTDVNCFWKITSVQILQHFQLHFAFFCAELHALGTLVDATN